MHLLIMISVIFSISSIKIIEGTIHLANLKQLLLINIFLTNSNILNLINSEVILLITNINYYLFVNLKNNNYI